MRGYDQQVGATENPGPASRAPRRADDAAPVRAAMPGRRPGLTPSAILRLQRTVGNGAVSAILQGLQDPADGSRQASPPRPESVQRSPVHDVLRSPGRPLADPVRADMEARLNADFSDVRVHTDAAAHESAVAVQAHAYTSGSHVVFQRGQYDTYSPTGQQVLAHELTHVIQQRRGPVAGSRTADGLAVSDPSDRFEQEAEATAQQVMASPAPSDAQRTPAGDA